jgi:molecular chaperone DnaK (HSP70)
LRVAIDNCKPPVSITDIDEVVMVGGATRMPQILEKVSAFFGNKKLHCQLHADEAIAVGAAIQGAIIGN